MFLFWYFPLGLNLKCFFKFFSVWTEYIDCYLNFNNLASLIWMLALGILGISRILSLFGISGPTSLVQVLIVFCLHSYENCLSRFSIVLSFQKLCTTAGVFIRRANLAICFSFQNHCVVFHSLLDTLCLNLNPVYFIILCDY